MFPALPTPAMARPMMKAVDVGAAAQMMEPTSNMKMSAMKAHLEGKKVCCCGGQLASRRKRDKLTKTLPMGSCNAEKVSRYALSYHAMSSKD